MPITERNATVALTGAQSDLVSEAKYSGQQRLVLEITNLNALGGNDVFVTVGQEAAANIGRIIKPQQTITWSTDAGYRPPNDRVHAYAAGATNLAVYEEIAINGRS